MNDDIDTADSGPIVSGETAPAPSETPRAPVPDVPDDKSHDQRVRDTFQDGLTLMAHGTEDASDFIAERKTQQKFLAGEDMSAGEMAAWHSRAQTALQRALDSSARARGEIPPSQQQAPAEMIPNYVPADAGDYNEHMASAANKVTEYFNSKTDIPDVTGYKESLTKVINANDPRGELTGYFMAAQNPGAMIESLAYEPDAIRYLVSLPQAQRAREMAKLEGYLHAQALAQQNANQGPQVRKFTAAPPPIKPVRGGAAPPTDVYGLASRGEDISAYVAARKGMNKQHG